jgi:hypothetical protein
VDHSPVDLPNILSRSKLHSSTQSSPSDDSEHNYFMNLQRNSRVRTDSDSFEVNSENSDSFQQLTAGNNGSVERRPLSELQVLSPESHSNFSDDRYINIYLLFKNIFSNFEVYLGLNLISVVLLLVNQPHYYLTMNKAQIALIVLNQRKILKMIHPHMFQLHVIQIFMKLL